MDLSNETMLHVKKDGIEYLQFRKLLEFDNLINCYTLSANNVDYRRNFPEENADILSNSYEKICKALNINKENIVRPYQTHTDRVEIVENTRQNFEKVDGLITNKSSIDFMLTFADCTPIFLYDPVKKVIADVHSGWRGTVQKIAAKAVIKMEKNFGSKPEDIIACIGPCIGKCCFEVEEDVKQIFEEKFDYMWQYDIIEKQKELIDGKQKYHIDTTLINRVMLQNIGLKSQNIIESGICTFCNSDQMHSYRANGAKSGRNVAILGMR